MTTAHRKAMTILNVRGLHARAAAKFVKLAETFDCQITVHFQGKSVSALSIMGLMFLTAKKNTSIEVEAVGKDAVKAIENLSTLVSSKFGEDR